MIRDEAKALLEKSSVEQDQLRDEETVQKLLDHATSLPLAIEQAAS